MNPSKAYKLATRGYMGRGKDGYGSLLVESEGGRAKELISEENGILISMILRQYFMSLKVLGRWRRWGKSMHNHWNAIHRNLHDVHPVRESAPPSPELQLKPKPFSSLAELQQDEEHKIGHSDVDSDSEDEDQGTLGLKKEPAHPSPHVTKDEWDLVVARKVIRKWLRLAGIKAGMTLAEEGEFTVGWTKGIAPRLEGRITMSGKP